MTLSVQLRSRIGSFDLDARFEAGAGITALFGPSGAGKTLTLRSIAGLNRPARGCIALGEETLFDSERGIDLPARARRIGYLFQHYALFPHLDVGRNIGYGIAHLDRADRERRIRELLQLIDLEGFERRAVGSLSGGQQQRIALARALAPDPQLLLLDEPFAAMDLRIRRRLRDELLRIHRLTGTPMLLVTHDLAEVRQLASSLVLIDAGRVLAAAPASTLLAKPHDPRWAGLLTPE